MKDPVERVSSWQLALSPDEQQIVLNPWVAKSAGIEEPAQHFALSLPIARALQRQLAESIRLLEQQVGQTPAPAERRRSQQRVPNDRRKARHFEGSPSSQAHPSKTSSDTAQSKPQK